MPETRYGRWDIVRSLGEGGQSHLFIVRDVQGDGTSEYVLKRLKNKQRLGRFRDEIDTLRALDHPNIVTVIDYDIEADRPYFVMPYFPNRTLQEVVSAWPTESRIEIALRIFIKVCDALAAAHAKSITHRDIKPSNILMRGPEGPPVVADFGLCFIEGGERQTVAEREAVGSRYYMAPEFEDGRTEQVLPVSDVYSLGKLLYFMMSGGGEFSREDHRADRRNLVLRYNNPRLELIHRILDRMVTYTPDQRYKDADEVLLIARQAEEILRHRYNVPSAKNPQHCTYCGLGTLTAVVNGHSDAANFGFESRGTPGQWLVLACQLCGHLEVFRMEWAQRRSEWWGQDDI